LYAAVGYQQCSFKIFILSFEQLHLIGPILDALKKKGYVQPTPIQAQSIPIILKGKDLLGCAQTGTGKTAAFAIPVLQTLYLRKRAGEKFEGIQALILTPTRELAIQIDESFTDYGNQTGLKHDVIFGGVSLQPQIQSLRNGVDILTATPGRLLDLIGQKVVNLKHISLFILDEADRMLDMGFIHDVRKVIALLPPKRQTLFFSATMPAEISGLANSILKDPEKVSVTPVSSTAEKVTQSIYFVDTAPKRDLLVHLLKTKVPGRVLVFSRTKHGADKIAKNLSKHGIKAEAIHGNKSQNARQRALENFKTGAIRALIATDIAARGIDVQELAYVINYDLPNVPETYVHRIGRTGRAGASGMAISFCNGEEREYLRDIQKLIKMNIPVVKEHPYAMTGAPA
jgi:ATP-dependent RNA helicase RhlE